MKDIKYRRDLYKLFTEPGQAVEVGVAEGNFSNDMLFWDIEGSYDEETETYTPAITKLYMVDRWMSVPDMKGDSANSQEWHEKNLEQVKQKTESFGDRAVILRGDSVEMADKVEDGSLTLVYIDGDHSYEGVLRDLKAWFPKLKWNGFFALHDFLNRSYGVFDAVHEFCYPGIKIYYIDEDKPEDAGCYFQKIK